MCYLLLEYTFASLDVKFVLRSIAENVILFHCTDVLLLEHVTTADVHFRESPDSIIETAASARSISSLSNGMLR